jgi:hypothetical protein
LRFLESRRMIDADLRRKVASELSPLHTALSPVLQEYSEDPYLARQQELWPSDAARESAELANTTWPWSRRAPIRWRSGAERLGLNQSNWVTTVRGFGRLFKQAAGRSSWLVDAAARRSRRWFQGKAAAQMAFT